MDGASEESVRPARGEYDERLAERLILDELFDLSLYRELRKHADAETRKTLDELIPIESRHFAFWQDFFDMRRSGLDLGRRLKLRFLVLVARVLGSLGIEIILEAIEVYGIRKYLSVWDAYRDGPLGAAVREILVDEFRHEDQVVTQLTERRINPQRIRDIFLGLNDGLVEILGAVSGFFAAFANPLHVLLAALMTAIAGAFSMAAGAYVATSSQEEVARTERRKNAFLSRQPPTSAAGESALGSAIAVGVSYLAGAVVPVLPVVLGAKTILVPAIVGGVITVVVSLVLAFLSGMEVRRRVVTNLAIIASAVVVTYLSGLVLSAAFGISP
jgi:VIT1/CCC1 family predicted Fe2+/Mn2+ transporter